MKKATTKKSAWVVKVNQGINGWRDFKKFDNPAAADEWLCNFVRSNGYWIGDFTIVKR